MKRSSLRHLRWLRGPLLLFSGFAAFPPQVAAIDSAWLAPTSGTWQDGSRWSTAPLAPSAPGDDATIAATGSPYTVLLNQNTSVATVTLSSADATLEVNTATLTAPGGIHLDAGALWLRGGTLKNTRVAGPGAFTISSSTVVSRFENVELARNATASSLTLAGAITLDNATLNTSFATLENNGSVIGAGTWIVGPSGGSSYNYHEIKLPSSGRFTVGPNVHLKAVGSHVRMTGTNTAELVNRGLISTAAGDRLVIWRLRNEGDVQVAGGNLEASVYGNVGRVDLTGGTFSLYGDLYFDQTVTVSNGATLEVSDLANANNSGQPIQLEAGGTVAVQKFANMPRVNSTGGRVRLDYLFTLSEFNQLPVTGQATFALGSSGILDLAQAELDLDALPRELELTRGTFRNGLITSATVPPYRFDQPAETIFDNVDLDLPSEVTSSRVTFRGTSTLSQPMTIDGGRLVLRDQWSNVGGVVITNGYLELGSAGAQFGSINMTDGTLGISYSTTLAQVQSFAVGTPEVIEILRYTGAVGAVDLQQQTLDLESSNNLWRVLGTISNGAITGDVDGKPLALANGTIADARLDVVRIEGNGTLRNVELTDSKLATGSAITMFGTTGASFTDVTIDGAVSLSGNSGDEPSLLLQGHTVLNGVIGGRVGEVRFAAGATLAGAGYFGNTSGRSQGITLSFEDDAFTIPAGVRLVSATQYDSTDRINAPDTHLHLAGDMLVGYTTFSNRRTDSWTIGVASLETSGHVEVTLDGRLAVNSPQWVHRGTMTLSDGLVEADALEMAATSAITGFGAIDTPNDSASPLVNNGHITGNSAAQPITLSGYVKGVGALDHVDVTGTFAPGASPATVTLGSVAYSGVLEIEIAGTAPGSFDRLEHTLNDGVAYLGGSLVVSLLDDFEPSLGNTFEFLIATGGVNGTFAAETLPELVGGLGWNLIYSTNSVMLEVVASPSFTADFDEDGDVDGHDLAEWLNDFGAGNGSDADGDNDSDGVDVLAWQRQLGSIPAPPAAAVPEPGGPAILVAAAIAGWIRSLCRRPRHILVLERLRQTAAPSFH